MMEHSLPFLLTMLFYFCSLKSSQVIFSVAFLRRQRRVPVPHETSIRRAREAMASPTSISIYLSLKVQLHFTFQLHLEYYFHNNHLQTITSSSINSSRHKNAQNPYHRRELLRRCPNHRPAYRPRPFRRRFGPLLPKGGRDPSHAP
jgi:hypothetical protein